MIHHALKAYQYNMIDNTKVCAYCREIFTPPKQPLTKRQLELMGYLIGYSDEHGCAPTFEEIASYFGFRSLATIHEHLNNLTIKGYIRRNYNAERGIEVLP